MNKLDQLHGYRDGPECLSDSEPRPRDSRLSLGISDTASRSPGRDAATLQGGGKSAANPTDP